MGSDSDSDSSSDQQDDVKNNGIRNKIKENITMKKELENDVNVKDTMLELEEFKMDKIPTNFIGFEKIWRRAKIKKNMIDDTLFSEMIETVHYISIQIDIKDGVL